MPLSYFFHPEASEEHLTQVAWYEEELPGLGKKYLAAFATAIERICRNPQSFPIDFEPDIRRLRIRNFPYTIIFREGNDRIAQMSRPTLLGFASSAPTYNRVRKPFCDTLACGGSAHRNPDLCKGIAFVLRADTGFPPKACGNDGIQGYYF